MISEKLMKPAQYAEYQLLTAILQGEFTPGTELPGERKLAEQIGVTRPTLRETLQKMAREGWLTIRHGKPTMVRDYLNEGGMGVMATMARYGEELPKQFIEYFLNFRGVIIPAVARMTMGNKPQVLEDYLKMYPTIEETAQAYTNYDWELQLLMASQSGNFFFRNILNDFDFIYRNMATDYFEIDEARLSSRNYYKELLFLVANRDEEGVEKLVSKVMDMALELWRSLSN